MDSNLEFVGRRLRVELQSWSQVFDFTPNEIIEELKRQCAEQNTIDDNETDNLK